MSDEFKIEVDWLEGADKDPIERSAFGQIVIIAEQQITTELEDFFARTIRPGLRASAYDLAIWLAQNWWRLRWEPEVRTTDWRLSHVVAAAGGGVAWPDISFVSDGVHVLVEAKATSGGRGAPVRYIRDLDLQISAEAFEAGIDEFVQRVLARLSSLQIGETDLAILWEQLLAERRDQAVVAQRRLEALLGFDPEEAPDQLIASLQQWASRAGCYAVEEVAAAAKASALDVLRNLVDRLQKSDVSMRIESALDISGKYLHRSPATNLRHERAAVAAKLARDVWGLGSGPVSNAVLCDLLSIPNDYLGYQSTNGLQVSAGLRNGHDQNVVKMVMRAKVPAGRRFEIMRLVADHIVAPREDHILPVTSAKTDRQKFQRSFAQEFLLPFEELYAHLGRPRPGEREVTDYEIEDVAEKYEVSPLLVRTTLVNRRILPREVLARTELY